MIRKLNGICMRLSHIFGSNDHYEYENWENHIENIFCYFFLTSKQKCCYIQMKQAGETYWRWKANHRFC